MSAKESSRIPEGEEPEEEPPDCICLHLWLMPEPYVRNRLRAVQPVTKILNSDQACHQKIQKHKTAARKLVESVLSLGGWKIKHISHLWDLLAWGQLQSQAYTAEIGHMGKDVAFLIWKTKTRSWESTNSENSGGIPEEEESEKRIPKVCLPIPWTKRWTTHP